jgi:hypothetical protein
MSCQIVRRFAWLTLKGFSAIALGLIVVLATSRAYAQQGYEIGDFESVSTIIGQANGPTFTANPADPPHLDGATPPDYLGMWSDAGDIQKQYFSGDLYNQLLSTTVGVTHGTHSLLTNQIPTDGGYHRILELASSGTSPTTTAYLHASAMKFDMTFDPAQLRVISTTNTYADAVVVIQTAAGYTQGKPTYDNLSVMDSSGNITSQPNYEASQYNPLGDPTDFNGTSKVTLTCTVNFTMDKQNGAGVGGNGDIYDPPTWKTYHQAAVAYDNANGAANDYANIQIIFQAGAGYDGSGNAAGVYVDNIRFIEPGDFNQDGHVDASDIPLAEKALTNPTGYEAMFNMTAQTKANDLLLVADVNGDGIFNNADLQALLTGLKNGTLNPVPEPASLILLGLGGVLFLAKRRSLGKASA